jgi:4-diphosphocytidyl-2-C-methyl-D-erythritol kinase
VHERPITPQVEVPVVLVIVKPDIHVSTREAFSGIAPKTSDLPVDQILSLPVAQWKGLLTNDFEETVFRQHPALKSMKERMYESGATYASMTGTGSAIFGIFEAETEASAQFPGAVKWSGFID